jgi:hypothetical protein
MGSLGGGRLAFGWGFCSGCFSGRSGFAGCEGFRADQHAY